MKFGKTINCALAVLVLISLLCGCAKKEDRSQEQSDTNSETNSQSSTVERQTNESEVTTPQASTPSSNGASIAKDLSSATDELHETIYRDIEKHIQYIEKHGNFSRDAQDPPKVQEAYRKNPEYMKASEFIKLAKKQGEMNQTEEADKSYRLAAQQYLKAATLHMDDDISGCTFAAAYQLCKSVSKPSKFDYETAYLLTRYSLIVNPNGRMSEHYRLVSREIEELKIVPTERLRELDQKAKELKRN